MVRLAAVLLLLADPWEDPQDNTQTESLPSVRPVGGNLLLWRASEGKVVPVPKEARAAPADRLGTKEGEPATFSTEGGTIVSLRGVRTSEERGLGIERREKKLFFRVYEGKLAVQTFEQGVNIETPQGQISATNAYLKVEVEKDGGVKLTSFSGEPAFTNSLGTVVLEAGKETVVEPGKKPSAPKSADVGKAMEEFGRHEAAFNLVKNPGFEEGLKEWSPPTFFSPTGKRQTEADTAGAFSGRSCLRLDFSNKIQGAKPDLIRCASQTIPAVPGKTYLFRLFYRTDLREGQVFPRIALYNVEAPDTWKVPTEKTWKMFTAKVIAKEKSLGLVVETMVQSDKYEGSFWVDDFFLAELPGPVKPQ